MPLPVKALQEGQFSVTLAGSAGSHAVSFVTFTNADGEIQTGWLKRLDDTYPELLAIFSVAVGVQMRMAVERVAEERLCFDKDGELIGTISLSLPDFKPMSCLGESTGVDEELRNPSVETLLRHNVAELLLASALSKDNDCHPGNFSVNGIIDRDESHYDALSRIIKGTRWINIDSLLSWESASDDLSFSDRDISDFPYLRGRTFTPTRVFPSNINISKTYKAYKAFQSLATNPSIVTAEGVITFHDQLFYAMLKEMVMFEPEVLRARLIEYLGDRPINFLALGEQKSQELAKSRPKLFKLPTVFQKGCNGEPDIIAHPGNNDESFVDVMMRFFQDEYDDAYRAIVNYIGCAKNIAETSVMSFSEYLQNKPADFEKIYQEARARNKLIEERWQAHCERCHTQDSEALSRPLHANCLSLASCHDLDKMERRYYQVWRDAYSLMFDGIMFKAKELSLNLAGALSLEQPKPSTSPAKLGIYDRNYTCSSQLIRPPSSQEAIVLNCDESNPLGQGYYLLNDFIFKLRQCAANYYLPCNTITMDKNISINQEFYQQLQQLFDIYSQPISNYFGSTSWAREFQQIYFELTQYRERLNFTAHLARVKGGSGMPINSKHDYSAILALDANHEDVISSSLHALFNWAKQVDKKTFYDIILPIIDDYARLNIYDNRTRGNQIKQYLKSQSALGDEAPSCDILLAYIFSWGGCKSTSLNTSLITKLLPIVVGEAPVDINLKALTLALERPDRIFNAVLYSEAAQKFVHKSSDLGSPYSDENVKRFNKLLYFFVAGIKVRDGFIREIHKLLSNYDNSHATLLGINYSWFKTKPSRKAEISKYIQKNTDNQMLIASIFHDGGYESTSFNTSLFDFLIKIMTEYCSQDMHKNKAIPQWFLSLDLNNNPHLKEHYLSKQQQYAIDFLAAKKAAASLSSSSSAVKSGGF